jgi:hypothetical protein
MKKFVLALLLAGVAVAPGAALAQGDGVYLRDTYYSDHTMQEVVGEFILMCDGSTTYMNGRPTAWYTQNVYPC